MLVKILYHKNVNSSSKKHIFEPQKRFGQSDFKTAFAELCGFELRRLNEAVLKSDCPNRRGGSNICLLLELFTFLWYNVSTSLGLNIFIGVCCLKNTNLLEIVL